MTYLTWGNEVLVEYRRPQPWLVDLLKGDPVRPNISIEDRFAFNNAVFIYWVDEKPAAICCASLMDYIPIDEGELFEEGNEHYDHACLYTIWSLQRGGARKLVQALLPHLRMKYAVARIVTLSPNTEMAKRFHLSNGAVIYRNNYEEETVNYEYEFCDINVAMSRCD